MRQVLDHFYNGAFVMETTPIVLWMLLTYADDPEEALVATVMAGRDADTNAAMVGNLVGALHGLEAFPARWTGDNLEDHDRLVRDAFPARWTGDNLEDHDRLVRLADALYDDRWRSA